MQRNCTCEKAQHIQRCLQLAIILEVSADKPGNVNLVVDFEGTRVEHFLASSVAAGPSFMDAAYRGIEIAQNKRKLDKRDWARLSFGASRILTNGSMAATRYLEQSCSLRLWQLQPA
jgi:triphosphoribosyl-dephospho-CoA synthetase